MSTQTAPVDVRPRHKTSFQSAGRVTLGGRKRRRSLAWLLMAASLVGLAATQIVQHWPSAASAELKPSAASAPTPIYQTVKIRDITPGTWVLAQNPELEGEVPESDFGDVVPSEWRQITLSMRKEDGGSLQLELLRPQWWLEEVGASGPGDEIQLDLDEIGAGGNAVIDRIDPCSDIPQRPSTEHWLVTGKFSHSAGEICDVAIEGLDSLVRCTPNHPIWSEDRQAFVQAGELYAGESLLNAAGERVRVVSVTDSAVSEPVYNLEVSGMHTYFVSSEGVLVHNAYSSTARYSLYVSFKDEALEYVGITKNIARRAAEHLRDSKGERIIRERLSNAGYRQARALEHLIIQKYGKNGLGVLANKQQGIHPRSMHKYSKEHWQWAAKMMKELGL